MRTAVALASLLLVAASEPVAPDTEGAWDCKFSERTVCGVDGCTTGPTKTWIYLTPSQNGYWRCEGTDFENCDQYDASVVANGAFRHFELPGRAAFAKVGPDLSVTEVITLLGTVYINRGQCIVGPPPLVRTKPL